MNNHQKGKFDQELQSVWSEGLEPEKAEKVLAELGQLSEAEPPEFHKTLKGVDSNEEGKPNYHITLAVACAASAASTPGDCVMGY